MSFIPSKIFLGSYFHKRLSESQENVPIIQQTQQKSTNIILQIIILTSLKNSIFDAYFYCESSSFMYEIICIFIVSSFRSLSRDAIITLSGANFELWSSKKKKRNYVSRNKSVWPGSSFQISHNTLVRCSFIVSLSPTFFVVVVVVVVHHTTLALHRPSLLPLAPSPPRFAFEADSSYFRFPATI